MAAYHKHNHKRQTLEVSSAVVCQYGSEILKKETHSKLEFNVDDDGERSFSRKRFSSQLMKVQDNLVCGLFFLVCSSQLEIIISQSEPFLFKPKCLLLVSHLSARN